MLDVWQADTDGAYEAQLDVDEARLRAKYTGGADGTYCVRTVAPLGYSIPMDGPVGELIAQTAISHFRPAHVHFLLTVPGYEPLITHLFQEGAEYLDSDVVFGTKEELVVGSSSAEPGPTPDGGTSDGAVAGGTVRLRAAAARLTGGFSVLQRPVLVGKVGAAHDPARCLVAAQQPHELRAGWTVSLRSRCRLAAMTWSAPRAGPRARRAACRAARRSPAGSARPARAAPDRRR